MFVVYDVLRYTYRCQRFVVSKCFVIIFRECFSKLTNYYPYLSQHVFPLLVSLCSKDISVYRHCSRIRWFDHRVKILSDYRGSGPHWFCKTNFHFNSFNAYLTVILVGFFVIKSFQLFRLPVDRSAGLSWK